MKPLASAALLLAAASVPHLFAQITPAPSPAPPAIRFDIVSLKACTDTTPPSMKNTVLPSDGDFVAKHCQSIARVIDVAYGGGTPYQLKGEPQWVDNDPYEFLAKVAPEDVPAWQKMDLASKRLMVRAALAESLNLKMHTEIQSRPVYNLVVAKDGLKIPEHKPSPDDSPANLQLTVGSVHWIAFDVAVYTRTSMAGLVSGLAARLDRDVVDKTGLTGFYDFTVTPLPYPHYDPKSTDVENADFAAIIAGVKNLGLRLEPGKADTSVLIVDHIDRPPTD